MFINWHRVTQIFWAFVLTSSLIFGLSAWESRNPLVMLIISISGTVQLLLSLYGLNSCYLLLKCLVTWDSPQDRERTLRKWGNRAWPHVTVQLPIYNERYVIERLLEHCIKFDYPPEKLEIQVLDDSTDGTGNVVIECIQRLRKQTPIKITHITRRSRSSFKAGALVLGTAQARGEFLAIFDADFTPDPDFLQHTIPRFADDKVGCVQCRWGHINDTYSLLTRLQAMGHDGHFVIEQFAKAKSNFTLNFNGTAGVWRRQCIMDAGDWSGDTLAEDLDLSYRAQLKGWRIDYIREVEVKAEVPLSISAFKKQQARWAKGSIQTAIKLLPVVWDSQTITNLQKFQASVHLCGYSVHPLMFFNLLATCCLFFLSPKSAVDHIMFLVIIAAFGPPCGVGYAQLYLGRPINVLFMPLLILLHHGLCLSNTAAVFEAFIGIKGSFERTPKFGSLQNNSVWASTSYAMPLRSSLIPWGEIMMALLLTGVILVGIFFAAHVNVYTYPWLLFFLMGYIMIMVFHLQEHQEVKAAHEDVATDKKSE